MTCDDFDHRCDALGPHTHYREWIAERGPIVHRCRCGHHPVLFSIAQLFDAWSRRPH